MSKHETLEKTPLEQGQWHVLEAFAGWILPGLGHFLLGERKRGLIIGGAIGALWLGGLLVGGISAIDRREHSAWFLGQMLIAPSVAVNQYHQHLKTKVAETFNRRDGSRGQMSFRFMPLPGDEPLLFEPAIGRAQEQGTLYTALAGVLNLLAVIDVLYRDRRQGIRKDGEPQGTSVELSKA